MSNQDLLAVIGVLGGVGLLTCVLFVVGVRSRKAHDAEGLAVRAADVASECGDLLVDAGFLWSVWQGTATASAMKILIRDAHDAAVSRIEVASVPADGVLKRFEIDGKRYEIRKPGLMSNRSCLHETGRPVVLCSATHTTRATTFFTGDGEREMFVIPTTSVLTRIRPIRAQGTEVGRLVKGIRRNPHARVLSLPERYASSLERVFILASL